MYALRKAGVLSILLVVVLLAVAVIADAQQAKVYRVGVLSQPGSQERSPDLKGLRVGLREAGYIEGRNLQFEHSQC